MINSREIDEAIEEYEREFQKDMSVDELIKMVNENFDTDVERARALFILASRELDRLEEME